MSVPDFQQVMLPLMEMASDGNEHSISEAMDHLARVFSLTEDDLAERIPSGLQTRFYNRVTWASTHLSQAGLINKVRRGVFQITEAGRELLRSRPARIDLRVLNQYPAYLEFRNRRRESNSPVAVEDSVSKTPDELLDDAYRTIRETLAADLLLKVKSSSAAFFEDLVVRVLVRMGYGGSMDDAGKAVGKSGDGGIDGIIKEDRLGLDTIYIQAKKWEGNVSRPEIQKFAGALMGNRARKGVFITTSDFTKEARDYVKSIDSSIILIDGDTLAQLMIEYNVGVSVVSNFEIKRIDSDYFED